MPPLRPRPGRLVILRDTGARAPRLLRPRAVLRGALPVLRLQHLHLARGARVLRRRRDRRGARSRRRCSTDGACRRSSSAAARRRCCRRPTSSACCARSTRRSGLEPDAEVTVEANPDSVDPAVFAELRGGRLHAGVDRDAERRGARAVRARAHALRDARGGRGARGAGGRVRAREPRPHVRQRRRRPTPTGARRSRPRCPPSPIT